MRNGKKLALITGATSGIGLETAKIFADHGINLIICGRRLERLEAIKQELQAKTEVFVLSFNVKNKKEAFAAFDSLPHDWKEVDLLINNAGNAHGLESFDQANLDDWDEMIDTNIKGVYYLTRAVLPQMIRRKEGHIVNIGSIAGREVYPNGNIYCASKFAVHALNTAMRLDLNKHGIKVSSINPGMVNTEFSLVRFKGDKERADNVYKGLKPLSGADIADVIYFMVSRPQHVNLADVMVLPLAQASSMHYTRE